MIITALSQFIGAIYNAFYNLFNNYGLALVGLSVVVTLIIYPLQKLSDKLKQADDREKEHFAPLMASIKQHYSGATAYYYMRYINRLYHYHPIKSMRSLGGLLVQIPFFIGAFVFLSHYEAFYGQSFWFIPNLGKPDALLFGFNVLPYLMTLFNVLATNILMVGKPLKDKLQLYGVAMLFLILLYHEPSALLFYWTCNNFFSLIKTIIDKLRKNKPIYDKSKLAGNIKLFVTFITRPVAAVNIVVSLVSLLFLYQHYKNSMLYHYYWICFALLWLLVAFNIYFFIKAINKNKNFLTLFILLIPIIIGTLIFSYVAFKTSLGGLGGFFGVNTTKLGSVAFLILLNSFLALSSVPALFTLYFNYVVLHKMRILPQWMAYGLIIILNLLSILFAPLAFIASSPFEVSDSPLTLVKGLLLLFVLSNFIFGFIYKFTPKALKNYFSFIILVLVLSSTLFGFFLVGNFGSMSNFAFTNLDIGTNSRAISILLYLIMACLALFLINNKGGKVLSGVVVIIFGVALFSVIKSSTTIIGALMGNKVTHNKPIDNNQQEAIYEPHYTFSKTKQNVVVVVLDRAIGNFAYSAFNDDEELRSGFTGFTYYPNTISFFNFTIGGLPLVMGGYNHNADAVNAREELSLEQEEINAAFLLTRAFANEGYQNTIANLESAFSLQVQQALKAEGVKIYNDGNRFVPLLAIDPSTIEGELSLSFSKRIRLVWTIGLFRLAGDVFKPYIYNEGQWLGRLIPSTISSELLYKAYSQLKALPLLSTNISERSNYIFIHNGTTHDPYTFLPNGAIATPKSDIAWSDFPENDRKRFNNRISTAHFYGVKFSLKALAEWFEWMKQNGVYNNSKIIITSDHGRDLSSESFPDSLELNKFNSLLLVKDFNSTTPLKLDNSFMTNADTPALALKPLPLADKLKSEGDSIKAQEKLFLYNIPFQNDAHKPNAFVYRRVLLPSTSYFLVPIPVWSIEEQPG
jgi:YidC/Oxa1 family membrane protein insertase